MSRRTPGERLAVDRLGPVAAAEVVTLRDADVGDAAGGAREPHRHDYHELIWVSRGRGEHAVDGRPLPVRPGTVTVIGRGQVHVFRWASGLHGAVVRFTDELLLGGGERIVTGVLLAGGGGLAIEVPPGARAAWEGHLAALEHELRRPADPYSADVQRNLVSTLLLWLERFHDGANPGRATAADPDAQLHRRFAQLLEADFARHHDAAHYAGELGVPPAALAQALTRATGRTTKELVVDRVLLEAARLLRFTDLTVQEVAHRVGYGDPLYFSRAFKRHTGSAPQAFRDAVRGGG